MLFAPCAAYLLFDPFRPADPTPPIIGVMTAASEDFGELDLGTLTVILGEGTRLILGRLDFFAGGDTALMMPSGDDENTSGDAGFDGCVFLVNVEVANSSCKLA